MRAKAEDLPTISRLDQLKKDGVDPSMPPNPAPHILARLMEIGLMEANGMGTSPISWREVVAWQEATGIRISAGEARLIRKLSTEYLHQSRRSEDETCPPPWRAEVTQRERELETARLEMVLG